MKCPTCGGNGPYYVHILKPMFDCDGGCWSDWNRRQPLSLGDLSANCCKSLPLPPELEAIWRLGGCNAVEEVLRADEEGSA